jgi:hypothetical protein
MGEQMTMTARDIVLLVAERSRGKGCGAAARALQMVKRWRQKDKREGANNGKGRP